MGSQKEPILFQKKTSPSPSPTVSCADVFLFDLTLWRMSYRIRLTFTSIYPLPSFKLPSQDLDAYYHV